MRTALAVAVSIAAGAAMYAVLAGAAKAQSPETSESVTPSFFPDRLHAKGVLTLTIRYAGGEFGVPSPVRRSLLRLPSGLGLDIPTLRSCSATRLRAHGARGCPAQSKIGDGHARMEARAGSQIVVENIALWIFLGPLQSFQPTFEVLGQGETPMQKRVILSGTVIPDRAPYGEELVMTIPPIPTLPLEPYASISALTLTVGTTMRQPARDANRVVVPRSCPIGGFPFAAESTYADGSTGSAIATASCPP